MNPWIAAARPKTLVAGIIPVLVGSALAFHAGNYSTLVFISALLGALSIQVGTNYVNDAADFERGADTNERLGPPRMAALGILSPKKLYTGATIAFLIAVFFGFFLIQAAGVGILWIGLISIFFAIIYTAGPFPLAYLGLGDFFVLIFFGIVAVLGTEYAHTKEIGSNSLLLSIAIGLHATSLIAVNNLRDIPTDIKAGKKTLAVRMGDGASRIYYSAIVLLPFFLWLPHGLPLGRVSLFLPYLSLPIALSNIYLCFKIKDRKDFNPLLARSALVQLLFGILLSLSLVINK